MSEKEMLRPQALQVALRVLIDILTDPPSALTACAHVVVEPVIERAICVHHLDAGVMCVMCGDRHVLDFHPEERPCDVCGLNPGVVAEGVPLPVTQLPLVHRGSGVEVVLLGVPVWLFGFVKCLECDNDPARSN